ncbi:arabinofuranosidase [Gordonia sp. HY285]|uniref:arabinofuranosidase n=1 Tax=Gordonia liuliyuniae TaxID=2911517 RepID=UPI001F1B5EEA|nr:arabinofuranosidase [Gordonia liuliyuniae]MCF8611443.1 arabinofuranosidase [Gordonia liuliyuniae]
MGDLVRASSVAAVTLLAMAGLLFATPGVSGAEPPEQWRYTMVAFSNASARDMDVYESGDGTQFRPVAKAAYRPSSGYIRDASIMRHTDGLYYVTYTTADGANIGFARSADRLTWTQMRNWPLPLCCAFLPGTGDGKGPVNPFGFTGSAGFKDGPSLSPFVTKAWAPEWFADGDRVSIIVSLSTGGGFMPYVMTAQDRSLRTWGLPVPLLSIGADHIDTTVVKIGPTYHAFTKNETKKVVEHAVASSLTGRYSFAPPGDWGSLVEGPAIVRLPDGAWRLYLDSYRDGRYLYSDSTDGLRTWSTAKELPGLSGTVRHIGIMREPA